MQEANIPTSVLYALLNQLQDAVFAIENGKFAYVNNQVTMLFGYSDTELIDHPFIGFVHKEDRGMVMGRYRARRSGEQVPDEYTFRIVTRAGAIREVNMRVGVIKIEGERLISIGSLQDITEQRQTRQALLHSQEDIASILDNMPDVFYRTDMHGVITMMSPSSLEAIGYKAGEMVGRPMADFYCEPKDRARVVQALMDGGGKASHVEACMVNKDGGKIWVSTNAHIRLDSDGHPVCIEGIARNITERKEMEEQLARMARLDDLTQLLNRRVFLLEAEEQLGIARRYGRPLVVIMIDLDHFKSLNDSYGHQFGDQALVYFAESCRSLFRKTDIIGRVGGEEFAVLMPESSGEAAHEVVERLKHHLKLHPLKTEKGTIDLTFSAGLVSPSEIVWQLDDLLRRADQLLYQAKKQGRNQVVLG